MNSFLIHHYPTSFLCFLGSRDTQNTQFNLALNSFIKKDYILGNLMSQKS